MAAASQCLEEGTGLWPLRPPAPYSEAQRLALQALVVGGAVRLPVVGAAAALPGLLLTYFPERSDAEPPVLELSWPRWASGAFRGLTSAEARFQPGCDERRDACKEAVRRQIRSARQVIALVMDSFTDIDIFGDIQDAYRNRKVPVYILLDQDFLPHFLEMCENLGVCPEQERLLRVRTLTGNTYYMRSGAKIIGKVHEKFMLIDGMRVTTGSYSFTWTDGKLNSSNLLLLSGQVVEQFDLEFRILYAQSNPISPKRPSGCGDSELFDHLVNRTESAKECAPESNLEVEFARLSSTPKKLLKEMDVAEGTAGDELYNLGRSGLAEDEWFSDVEAPLERKDASTQTGHWEGKPVATCDGVTQTSVATVESGTQTSVAARITGTQTSLLLKTAVTQTKEGGRAEVPLLHRQLSSASGKSISSLRSLSSSSSQCSLASSASSLSSIRSVEYPASHRAGYFQKLHKERQFHYSTIRSRLSHMVDLLSRRGRVPENYPSQYPGRCTLK
ncbi:F83DB protein, partial [Crypturellus undulatus]|nr:F83DB protein [Crypturellus undulatus]